MRTCPSCDSEKIRRGGMIIWLIYVALIAFAIVATLVSTSTPPSWPGS